MLKLDEQQLRLLNIAYDEHKKAEYEGCFIIPQFVKRKTVTELVRLKLLHMSPNGYTIRILPKGVEYLHQL